MQGLERDHFSRKTNSCDFRFETLIRWPPAAASLAGLPHECELRTVSGVWAPGRNLAQGVSSFDLSVLLDFTKHQVPGGC